MITVSCFINKGGDDDPVVLRVWGESGMKGRVGLKTKWSITLFCICLIVFSFGCEKESGQKISGEELIDEEHLIISKAIIEPLPILEEDFLFESSHGWLDDDTIVFSAKKEEVYYLYSYNLSLKKKDIIYQTNKMIAEASISPNGKYILIYTFEDDAEAFIHILNVEGKEQYEVAIPSREIAYSWNRNSEAKLLMNAFYEDWTFSTFILDVKDGQMEEIHLSQPFAKWYSEEEFIYVQLDEEESELTGSLLITNENNDYSEVVLENVVMFENGKEILLAAQTSNENTLEYVFLSDREEKNRLIVELDRSDTFGNIPEFDLHEGINAFYTFIPFEQTYQFIMYNYEKGNYQVVLEDLATAPISVSPNGKRALYGYSLENLIEISVK